MTMQTSYVYIHLYIMYSHRLTNYHDVAYMHRYRLRKTNLHLSATWTSLPAALLDWIDSNA
jgi:hypothetical protein